eukprot:CAMPEP_0113469038 /NCGR_PEP_ID=MMETSP0014_2-20120614/15684_1 /TAXON_ID=2857 /ORGANISM="Nitzschia sp." /LENGTH=87 /DNA_ID=CAMNT_0000361485 /DNA_START=405 /DNA_END=664 /DNA_ORIENTATION=+ /assembly_acc=CAM_ASM_000159
MAKKNHQRGGSGSQKEQHKRRKKAQNGSTSSAIGKRLHDEAMFVKESRRHRENPNSDYGRPVFGQNHSGREYSSNMIRRVRTIARCR